MHAAGIARAHYRRYVNTKTNVLISSALCIMNFTCFSHLQTRLLFGQQHVNPAVYSPRGGFTWLELQYHYTLYMLNTPSMCKAEQTSRTSSTTVTCRGLGCQWIGPLQAMSYHITIVYLLGIQELRENWMLSASGMSTVDTKQIESAANSSPVKCPKN
jgi:hypothetical protein